MEIIYFAKTKNDAKIPSKRIEDAGYDIYPCFDKDYMIIDPHSTVMIPAGIASACSPDYAFILKERGSTGTRGLGQRCGVIDSGYRGEWMIPITNVNDVPICIYKKDVKMIDGIKMGSNSKARIDYPYEKAICQAILVPVPKTEIQELTFEQLLDIASERKDGKLGSSNK